MKPSNQHIHINIVERMKKGDKRACSELYQLYYKAMFNTCLRMVNNREDAEDIMQESFIKAFKNINQFSGKVTIGSWLKKIVINSSLDYLKKSKVYFESLDLHNDLTDDITFSKEINIDAVNKALKELPDKYRVIFSLNMIEGYDHEEISEILHISNANSRTLFFRAKKMLKHTLQKME